MSRQKRSRGAARSAAGAKMFISVSAVAATLVGWGALARDELIPETADQPIQDVRSKVEGILGDMPELIQVEAAAPTQETPEAEPTPELRAVTLPKKEKSSRPKSVSRTKSSS